MARLKTPNDSLEVIRAVRFLRTAMENKKRQDGFTPMHHHSLCVMIILRDILGVKHPIWLAVGLLHDVPEDTGYKASVIGILFHDLGGPLIQMGVENQTYDPPETSKEVLDLEFYKKVRRKKKLARVRESWGIMDCVVSFADIIANLFLPSGEYDPIAFRKHPYWNWAVRQMLPAIERRLKELRWKGLLPSELVDGRGKYLRKQPIVPPEELARLDAIE